MLRLIQSDYTSRGAAKIPEAIKLAKAAGETPVLSDPMSLNGLAEFALECQKQGVKGLIGLKAPLLIQGSIVEVTLTATSNEGLVSLRRLVEEYSQMDGRAFDLVNLSLTDVDVLVEHTFPRELIGTPELYRERYGELRRCTTGKVRFALEMASREVMIEHPELGSHNVALSNWLKESPEKALAEACILVTNDAYHGGEDGYFEALGRYLHLNTKHNPSIGLAKRSIPAWMCGDERDSIVASDLIASQWKTEHEDHNDYVLGVLKPEQITDLGIDWDLREEMSSRLEKKLSEDSTMDADAYRKLLEHELEVVYREGYEQYFLNTFEFANYAAQRGIRSNTRGSGANSLIVWLSGLSSDISDPLRNRLNFLRFMGARLETPDLDLDIEKSSRDAIFDFLHSKVGEGSVGELVQQECMTTFVVLMRQARQTLLVKYGEGKLGGFSLPKQDVDDYWAVVRVKEAIEKSPSKSRELHDVLELSEVKQLIQNDPYFKALTDLALKQYGYRANATRHVSAVVVEPSPDRPMPFLSTAKGYIASVPHEYAKNVGLLKYDILSSSVIEGLGDAERAIGLERFEKKLNECIEDKDGSIYKFIAKNPQGLNQLSDNDYSRNQLKQIAPTSFNELVAYSAILRPGVSDRKDYLKRAKKKAFSDPQITEILSDTRGFVIFEDQILSIGIDGAGMKPSDADILRTGLKKNKTALIDSQEVNFTKGLVANGRTEKQAQGIWAKLKTYAGQYLFNKGHATEYGSTALKQAVVKAYWPEVFVDEIVRVADKGESYKDRILPKVLGEFASRGITIMPPDIRTAKGSETTFARSSEFLELGLSTYGVDQAITRAHDLRAKSSISDMTLNSYIFDIYAQVTGDHAHSLLEHNPRKLKKFKRGVGDLIEFGFFDEVPVSEGIDLTTLEIVQRRNLMLQASEQIIDHYANPFPDSPTPSVQFEGVIRADKNALELKWNRLFGANVFSRPNVVKQPAVDSAAVKLN